jgi:hypothetical protein
MVNILYQMKSLYLRRIWRCRITNITNDELLYIVGSVPRENNIFSRFDKGGDIDGLARDEGFKHLSL